MSKRYAKDVIINSVETNAYTCEINYLDKNPNVQKVLAKAGIHMLEEAILDILPAPNEVYMDINAIKTRLELPIKMDNNYNWAGFLIEGILNKLQSEFRTEPERKVTEGGKERRIGWRLSQNEYERRLDNEEKYIDE